MSGRKSRSKGQRRERELVKLFQSWGLKAERVPLSGAAKGSYSGDVDVYRINRDAPLVGEVKSRKDGWLTLHRWLEHDGADFLALKTDNKEWLFLVPEKVMRELM